MKLLWPIEGIGYKPGIHISQKFGQHLMDYSQFGLKGHNGIDIGAPQGTPVKAAHSGQAVYFPDRNGTGNTVNIYGDGLMTNYGHFSRFEGSNREVKAGEIIGYVGSTGFSSGPHLHFGLRFNQANQADGYLGYSDPAPYMKIFARVLQDGKELSLVIPMDKMERFQLLAEQLSALDDYQVDTHPFPFKKPYPTLL